MELPLSDIYFGELHLLYRCYATANLNMLQYYYGFADIQIRPTVLTIGLIICYYIALFFVYTEFRSVSSIETSSFSRLFLATSFPCAADLLYHLIACELSLDNTYPVSYIYAR